MELTIRVDTNRRTIHASERQGDNIVTYLVNNNQKQAVLFSYNFLLKLFNAA